MTSRQADLVLWLGSAGRCGPSGIKRAGWAQRTIDRCVEGGWIEQDPNHQYSYKPTPRGLSSALYLRDVR